MLAGESYKELEYKARRNMLKSFFKNTVEFDTTIVMGHLAMPRAWKLSKFQTLWDYVVSSNGGEGIMVKNLTEKDYAKSWTKVKKAFTVDAFVIGIEKGKGKYEGQLGSLIIALYDHNKNIQEIGKCSGMTDKQRQDFTDRAIAGTLKGMVCEVSANEVTKNLKLRHPQFVRERTDKPADQCTIITLNEIASNI
jgi:ATP-dependent DNA ligase